MTECDRIVEQGILPSSFFNEETICDFFVDINRKKLWAICIDLLIKFDSLCRCHGLHYAVSTGALLGIIRHNGFIPWDDDIDVFMPRADYEKLRKLKGEFNYPYFLQFPGEDNDYYVSFAKLRNSQTSAISWKLRYCSFNQGCYIDIFPLDNYCELDIESQIADIGILVAEVSALMRRSCPNPDANDLRKMAQFPKVRSGKSIVKELDDLCMRHYNDYADKYVVNSCLVYHYSHFTYDKVLFDDLIEVPFYGHDVFIPRNYHDVLRILYGDYLQLPPLEERGRWHSGFIIDTDTPYKDLLFGIRTKEIASLSNGN